MDGMSFGEIMNALAEPDTRFLPSGLPVPRSYPTSCESWKERLSPSKRSTRLPTGRDSRLAPS